MKRSALVTEIDLRVSLCVLCPSPIVSGTQGCRCWASKTENVTQRFQFPAYAHLFMTFITHLSLVPVPEISRKDDAEGWVVASWIRWGLLGVVRCVLGVGRVNSNSLPSDVLRSGGSRWYLLQTTSSPSDERDLGHNGLWKNVVWQMVHFPRQGKSWTA